jgi:hypothetical protein
MPVVEDPKVPDVEKDGRGGSKPIGFLDRPVETSEVQVNHESGWVELGNENSTPLRDA